MKMLISLVVVILFLPILFLAMMFTPSMQGACDGDPTDIDTVFDGDIAKTIFNVGREVGASPRAMESAFLAAQVESRFTNPTEEQSDLDSAGAFQQRRSWVPADQQPTVWSGTDDPRLNPTWAAAAFFKGSNGHRGALYYDAIGIDYAGRKITTAGQLAQAVQVSAYPARYDEARPIAMRVFGAIAGQPIENDGCAIAGTIPGAGSATPLDVKWLPPQRLNAPHHDYAAWDAPAPANTPFFAVASGKVSAVLGGGRCGNGVQIIDQTGAIWLYCHANRINVYPGATIQASQQLGLVGSTGNSTGNHLHMGVTVNGSARCPQLYITAIVNGQQPPRPSTLPTSGCIS